MSPTGKAGRLAALAAAAVLALAACSQGGDTTGGAMEDSSHELGMVDVSPAPETPTPGGTLVFAALGEPRQLDPSSTTAHGGSGGTEMAAVYDVLVRYNFESREYEPWLAEDLASDEDQDTWRLTLREGVTFSDGSPFDAEAVVASIQHYQEEFGFGTPLLMANVKSMAAENSRTVVFELNSSWPGFPALLAQGPGMIMAPAAYAGEEFTPIGAGPFISESYKPQEELVLTANQDYWKGKPPLEKVRFNWFLDDRVKLDGLNGDQFHAAYMIEPSAVADTRAAGFGGFKSLTNLTGQLTFNMREGHPTADPRIRQAISLVLDPEVIAERTNSGQGIPGRTVFSELSKWSGSLVEAPEFDAEKAQAMVDEAAADGTSTELVLTGSGGPVYENIALSVKAMLEQIGLTVEVELSSSASDNIQRVFIDHDFDIVSTGWSIPDSDPYPWLYNYVHSTGTLNAAGYTSEEMDGLLAQLQAAETTEDKESVYTAIQEQWWEDAIAVPTASGARFATWQDDVHGIVPTDLDIVLLGEAWIEN